MRTKRMPVIVGCVLAVLLVATGSFLVVRAHRAPATHAPTLASAPKKLPPGPTAGPNLVRGPDGATMSCPVGPEPELSLTAATFNPQLTGGTSFGRGRYRVSVRGTVGNDTTATIRVNAIVMTVNDRPWTGRMRTPQTVRAHGTALLSADGIFDSSATQRASLSAHVSWVWSAAVLRPCGKTGLVEDD
jgi:hypothetical protein